MKHHRPITDDEGRSAATEAITRAKAAYFRTLDAKLWDEFALLFTEDCEFITYRDRENLKPKPRRGRSDIVSSVRTTVGDALTHHEGKLAEIAILSAATASAIWEMTDYAEFSADGARRILRGAGRYYEQYQLVGETWLISRLELRRTKLVVE